MINTAGVEGLLQSRQGDHIAGDAGRDGHFEYPGLVRGQVAEPPGFSTEAPGR